jgi:endonuclease/exonuclease/phosphatase family metal-dependent hydrolase
MKSLVAATYNIRHGLGTDGVIDLERTAEVVRATGAEFVALQELDRNLKRSGRADQPAVLAELTGLEICFFPVLERRGGEYGIAVGARAPVETSFVSLPRLGREEPRGLIIARYAGVAMVAVHLSTDRRARRAQIEAVAALVGDLDGPVVLLGDLNQTRAGLSALVGAGLDPGPSVASLGRRQIDFVMPGPGLRAGAVNALSSPASDHRALVAVLEPT